MTVLARLAHLARRLVLPPARHLAAARRPNATSRKKVYSSSS